MAKLSINMYVNKNGKLPDSLGDSLPRVYSTWKAKLFCLVHGSMSIKVELTTYDDITVLLHPTDRVMLLLKFIA